jgi:NAD(P) transhydrogenase subunit alpha
MHDLMDIFIQSFNDNILFIYLLIFTIILGFEVISKVPTVLHTPLMSGANAVSGVVILGAILLIRQSEADDYVSLSLGFIGVVLGMLNAVGGFVVTDRMLEMFKKKKK